VTAAARTHPELIRSPRTIRRRISHFHLRAAPHTADVEIDVAHAQRFYNMPLMIPALVLAAGRSSRMGRPKATLPIPGDGDTFLTRIVRTLLDAELDDVVVVLGHDAESIAESFAATALRARSVLNPDYDRGQLSSLKAGLTTIDRPGVEAVLLTLVDVPLVSASTVRAILERYRQTHAPIVRPVNGERHGHPLIIDRALFSVVRAADEAQGLKPIVRSNASPLGDVIVGDEGAFVDIDSMEDYRRLVGGQYNSSRR